MGWKTYPPQYVHWFYLVLNKISWIQSAAKPGWYKVAADNIKKLFFLQQYYKAEDCLFALYLYEECDCSFWNNIVWVSDWVNNVFSHSFTSNLWIEMWKILVCIKKNIFILWKVFKQFLFTSCNASKNLFVHCAHMFFFMYCNLWIEIIALSME